MTPGGDMEAARRLFNAGRLDEADALCQAMVAREPGNHQACYRLGMIAHARGEFPKAVEWLDKAIRLASGQPAYPYTMALVREDMGEFDKAREAYGRALALKPDLIQALNNLGVLLARTGLQREGLEKIGEALRYSPRYASAWNNRGTIYKDLGQLEEAGRCFAKAVEIDPTFSSAHANLGAVLMSQGRRGEARTHFIRAAETHPDRAVGLNGLGKAYKRLGELDNAIESLRQAVELKPDYVEAKSNLAALYVKINRTEAALDVYRQILAEAAENPEALLGYALSLPVVYGSAADQEHWRRRFGQELGKLAESGRLKPGREAIDALERTNFYLAYQGQDDRTLQKTYGDMAISILSESLPALAVPLEGGRIRRDRKRIGFVSALFHKCTVGYYFKSWITGLDHGLFEIHVYNTGDLEDDLTGEIRRASDKYLHLNGPLEDTATVIRNDALDVLIYPEIGMYGKVFELACLRLAPVQCAAWGHPVTTGLSSMDYYLSCDEMEPEGAETQYTEKLVRLPGMGTRYERPRMPTRKSRAELGLPEDAPLLLCPQSLFKIHPDNDALIARVLAGVPGSRMVFFKSVHDNLMSDFRARLEKHCAEHGVAFERLHFLDPVAHEDYLRINMACDLMLDTLHWSGGNTALDALASGLPIVTLPGRFMRGRQTMAFLKRMECDELIAGDTDDYVRIATALAAAPERRRELSARIVERADRVFGRDEPIEGLTAFLAGL